jgi:hypothetical protein
VKAAEAPKVQQVGLGQVSVLGGADAVLGACPAGRWARSGPECDTTRSYRIPVPVGIPTRSATVRDRG